MSEEGQPPKKPKVPPPKFMPIAGAPKVEAKGAFGRVAEVKKEPRPPPAKKPGAPAGRKGASSATDAADLPAWVSVPVPQQTPVNPLLVEQEEAAKRLYAAEAAVTGGGGGGGGGGSGAGGSGAGGGGGGGGGGGAAKRVKKEKSEPGEAVDMGSAVNYDRVVSINEAFDRTDPNMPITMPLAAPAAPHFVLEPHKPFLLQLPSHLTIGNVPERQQPSGARRGLADDGGGGDVAAGARGKQKLSARDLNTSLPAGQISLDAPLQALSVAKLVSDGMSLRDSQADALLQAASSEIDEDADDVLPGNRFNNKFIEQGIQGEIGELRQYSNGRMTMFINGQELLLQRGVYPDHYMELVCVEPGGEAAQSDKLFSGLQLHENLIATVSTTHLLDSIARFRQQ
jgi:hypothetical protein